jgi:hypothetical protein
MKNNRAAAALPLMWIELALASWETMARRNHHDDVRHLLAGRISSHGCREASGTQSYDQGSGFRTFRSDRRGVSSAAVAWFSNRERQASSTEVNSARQVHSIFFHVFLQAPLGMNQHSVDRVSVQLRVA